MISKVEVRDMTSKEIVKELIKATGNSVAGVSKVIGVTTQGLWNMLNAPGRKSLTVDNLCRVLDVLGYKVVIVSKGMNVKKSYEVEE